MKWFTLAIGHGPNENVFYLVEETSLNVALLDAQQLEIERAKEAFDRDNPLTHLPYTEKLRDLLNGCEIDDLATHWPVFDGKDMQVIGKVYQVELDNY